MEAMDGAFLGALIGRRCEGGNAGIEPTDGLSSANAPASIAIERELGEVVFEARVNQWASVITGAATGGGK